MAESPTTTPKAFGVYLFTDKKPLKRLGFLSGVVNTQLKQVLMRGSVDVKHVRGR